MASKYLSTHSVLTLEAYHRANDQRSETGVSKLIASGTFVVLFFVIGSLFWAFHAKLDGAVLAEATFVVDGNRKTVEHLDGGIIKSILVSDGDRVRAGQTVLELESSDVQAELDIIRGQLSDLTVRRARLLAQIEDATVFMIQSALEGSRVGLVEEDLRPAFETQKLLFLSDQRSRRAEADLLQQRIASLQTQASGLEAQHSSNRRQIEIAQTELEDLERLLDKGLVGVARVNARRIEVERLNGEEAAILTRSAQVESETSELLLSNVSDIIARSEALSQELAQVEAELASLEPRYSSALARLERVSIVAPVSGQVVSSTEFTQGGVVRPAEPILDIVPLNKPLVAEARIATTDIEKLSVGQSTRVRLTAFNLADVPEAQGTVVDLSADRIEDTRTGQFFFTARVALDANQGPEIDVLTLVPGMPAEVLVNTGEQTVLSYLTRPVLDRFARTFVE